MTCEEYLLGIINQVAKFIVDTERHRVTRNRVVWSL